MALTSTSRIRLKEEVQTDPLTLGYATMTDQQVLTSLTGLTRTRDRDSMTGDEIFQQTMATEYNALTGAKQGHWLAFCGRETIDPFAAANEQFVSDLFGTATGTLSNLKATRKESISRLTELGIGTPTLHQIAVARS